MHAHAELRAFLSLLIRASVSTWALLLWAGLLSSSTPSLRRLRVDGSWHMTWPFTIPRCLRHFLWKCRLIRFADALIYSTFPSHPNIQRHLTHSLADTFGSLDSSLPETGIKFVWLRWTSEQEKKKKTIFLMMEAFKWHFGIFYTEK